MRENDFNYIKEVTEFFNSTRSEDNPKGNISAVTEKFSISRTKATKILITSGAIDTPLHRQVMKLKEEGYDVEEIALALEISEATVKTNMPYEKVVYNGDSKSLGAEYIEKLRQKEKEFRKNVLKRPTELVFVQFRLTAFYNAFLSIFFCQPMPLAQFFISSSPFSIARSISIYPHNPPQSSTSW